MEKRLNKMLIFIGKKGSGKTYFTIKEFLPAYLSAHPNHRILIITPGPHKDYMHIPEIKPSFLKKWTGAGMYRISDISDIESVFEDINQYMYNGLVLMEDATAYMSGKLQIVFKQFWIMSKQHNLDVVYQFHSFACCPPELLRQCDVIKMFRCDNPFCRKEILAHIKEDVESAYHRILRSKHPFPNETILVN